MTYVNPSRNMGACASAEWPQRFHTTSSLLDKPFACCNLRERELPLLACLQSTSICMPAWYTANRKAVVVVHTDIHTHSHTRRHTQAQDKGNARPHRASKRKELGVYKYVYRCINKCRSTHKRILRYVYNSCQPQLKLSLEETVVVS